MAKTHLSLSHDPNLKGARPASRVPDSGDSRQRGRGLPLPAAGHDEHHARPLRPPAFFDIDIDPVTGKIVGLS
jgi:methylenetetrahydrofolate dehydrogenase (NADP+)/methenyltetrahydrofolate cyclohydrolase/formyltetrahydrofolate synthetase